MKLDEQKTETASKNVGKKNLPRIKEIKNTSEIRIATGGNRPRAMGLATLFIC